MVSDSFILSYGPTDAYLLRYGASHALGVEEELGLEKLHTIDGEDYEVFSRENDQSTIWHELFYANCEESFLPVYREFIKWHIRPLFRESIVYQNIPTFRVHLPNNLAIGEAHKDSDYGHADGAINFWVPLTPTNESNCLWLETRWNSGRLEPVVIKQPQMIMFDGVNLTHKNQLGQGWTRVSFDFRVIPESLYKESDRTSINTGMRFAVGDYYSFME